MRRASVFIWIPRDVYPGRKPFFGGSPTWVFLKKIRYSSKEALKEYLLKIFNEFPISKVKVIDYVGGKSYPSYYTYEQIED